MSNNKKTKENFINAIKEVMDEYNVKVNYPWAKDPGASD